MAAKALRAGAGPRRRRDRDGPLEIALLLTGDAEQQVINREWRQIDKPTNVLSFPQGEPFDPLLGPVGDLSFALRDGDARIGRSRQEPSRTHFTHLLVHGTLHLVGYDHQTEAEALVMEGLETEITRRTGDRRPLCRLNRGAWTGAANYPILDLKRMKPRALGQ